MGDDVDPKKFTLRVETRDGSIMVRETTRYPYVVFDNGCVRFNLDPGANLVVPVDNIRFYETEEVGVSKEAATDDDDLADDDEMDDEPEPAAGGQPGVAFHDFPGEEDGNPVESEVIVVEDFVTVGTETKFFIAAEQGFSLTETPNAYILTIPEPDAPMTCVYHKDATERITVKRDDGYKATERTFLP